MNVKGMEIQPAIIPLTNIPLTFPAHGQDMETPETMPKNMGKVSNASIGEAVRSGRR